MSTREIQIFKIPFPRLLTAEIIERICRIGFHKTGQKFTVLFNGSKGYVDNFEIQCEGQQLANNRISLPFVENANRQLTPKMEILNVFYSEISGIRLSLGKDESQIVHEDIGKCNCNNQQLKNQPMQDKINQLRNQKAQIQRKLDVLTTHQSVLAEKIHLKDKLDKLETFLWGKPTGISIDQIKLLQLQRNIMSSYLQVLDMRIRHFEGPKASTENNDFNNLATSTETMECGCEIEPKN